MLRAARASRGGSHLAALTFDDGPHPSYTLPLLRELRDLDVRATFFCIGAKVIAEPDLCRALVAAGMEIGNHSMRHVAMDGLEYSQQRQEIDDGAAAIAAATGVRTRYFRPPYGKYDAATIAAAEDCGSALTLWNVDAQDWDGIDASSLTLRLCARACDPAVIVLHDHAQATAGALRHVVRAYRAAGFDFVTLSELFAAVSLRTLNAARPVRVVR